jgi:hypothetical protein
MSKSSARGARTSAEAQVLGLTPYALWLLVRNREFMLDFRNFPWFARASIEDVSDVKLVHGKHLHWPRLDVDLHIDSLEFPERFPLVSREGVREVKKRPSGNRVKRRRASATASTRPR